MSDDPLLELPGCFNACPEIRIRYPKFDPMPEMRIQCLKSGPETRKQVMSDDPLLEFPECSNACFSHAKDRVAVLPHSPNQSTLDALYVYVVPWSEFSIVPSYPHICSAMVGVPHRPLLP